MIHSPDQFNASLPAGYDGHFDWDFLNGAFGPTVMPMDFDGVVERKGRFWLFETKKEGVPIPKGQLITLESAQATGFFTICILRGKNSADIKSAEYWYDNGHKISVEETDFRSVRQECAEWWEYASRQSKPDNVWRLYEFLNQYSQEITDLKKELKLARQEIDRLSCRVDFLEKNFSLTSPKAPNKNNKCNPSQIGMFAL